MSTDRYAYRCVPILPHYINNVFKAFVNSCLKNIQRHIFQFNSIAVVTYLQRLII